MRLELLNNSPDQTFNKDHSHKILWSMWYTDNNYSLLLKTFSRNLSTMYLRFSEVFNETEDIERVELLHLIEKPLNRDMTEYALLPLIEV